MLSSSVLASLTLSFHPNMSRVNPCFSLFVLSLSHSLFTFALSLPLFHFRVFFLPFLSLALPSLIDIDTNYLRSKYFLGGDV